MEVIRVSSIANTDILSNFSQFGSYKRNEPQIFHICASQNLIEYLQDGPTTFQKSQFTGVEVHILYLCCLIFSSVYISNNHLSSSKIMFWTLSGEAFDKMSIGAQPRWQTECRFWNLVNISKTYFPTGGLRLLLKYDQQNSACEIW